MVNKLAYQFPMDASIQTLRLIGVKYIIVHKKEFDMLHKNGFMLQKKKIADGTVIIEELRKNKSIKFIKKLQDDYVFKML